MATLIFLAVFICLLVLAGRLITHIARGKDAAVVLRMMLILVSGYVLLWLVFFVLRQDKEVALGVDSCFDDWCVTVTAVDRPAVLGRPERPVDADGQFVILTLRMSNQAKGIGQRPSEHRVMLMDEQGRSWRFSTRGQQALEASTGRLPPLDAYLGLHQSLETEMVFDIPKDARGLKARIEEGPPIINFLLLPVERKVFPLP
jgi:hypothetical protein